MNRLKKTGIRARDHLLLFDFKLKTVGSGDCFPSVFLNYFCSSVLPETARLFLSSWKSTRIRMIFGIRARLKDSSSGRIGEPVQGKESHGRQAQLSPTIDAVDEVDVCEESFFLMDKM